VEKIVLGGCQSLDGNHQTVGFVLANKNTFNQKHAQIKFLFFG